MSTKEEQQSVSDTFAVNAEIVCISRGSTWPLKIISCYYSHTAEVNHANFNRYFNVPQFVLGWVVSVLSTVGWLCCSFVSYSFPQIVMSLLPHLVCHDWLTTGHKCNICQQKTDMDPQNCPNTTNKRLILYKYFVSSRGFFFKTVFRPKWNPWLSY